MYSHEQFVSEVLSSSDSSCLQDALEEWNIVANSHEPNSHCFCGHPISDVFTLRNMKNGNVLPYVGSKCVKRFGPKMEHRLAKFKQGKKVVKKGKMAGLTYDAVCRDHFDYVKWLSRYGADRKEHRAILAYARWLFS